MALVAFAVCVLAGLQAANPFATVVSKALVALTVTFAVGLVLGTMAQKMLDENMAASAAKSPADANSPSPGITETKADARDR